MPIIIFIGVKDLGSRSSLFSSLKFLTSLLSVVKELFKLDNLPSAAVKVC